jgi:hypothetical protein
VTLLSSESEALCGFYLYQGGRAFLNCTASEYQEAFRKASDLDDSTVWWDLQPALTYWHEADHFQMFTCSPYLHFVSDLLEQLASNVASVFELVKASPGWGKIPPLLCLAKGSSLLTRETDLRLDLAAFLRATLHCLLSSPHVSPSFQSRLSDAVRITAGLKGWESRAELRSRGTYTRTEALGFTPLDLLEACARMHELGHLRAWGASTEQIRFWAESCLFGRYGTVLLPLFGRVEPDLIHACLILSFRAPFFPFLDAESPIYLEDAYPPARFGSMIDALLECGRAVPTGRDARSLDSRIAFCSRVIEQLREEFVTVDTGDSFRASDASLWRTVIAGEGTRIFRDEEAIKRIVGLRAQLSSARERRFSLESECPEWLVGEATMFPDFRILPSGEAQMTLKSEPDGADGDDLKGWATLGDLALTQAVGDAAFFGDHRLYRYVAQALGFRRSQIDSLMAELGVNRHPEDFPQVPFSDWDLDYALE